MSTKFLANNYMINSYWKIGNNNLTKSILSYKLSIVYFLNIKETLTNPFSCSEVSESTRNKKKRTCI